MSPTHTNKKGKRYRYYISQALIKGRRVASPHGRRLPAAEVEALVEDRLGGFLNSEAEVFAAIEPDVADHVEASRLAGQATELSQRWRQFPPAEQRRILLAVLVRVDIRRECVEIRVNTRGLVSILRGEATSPDRLHNDEATKCSICWSVPVRLRRTGIEKRLLIDGASHSKRRAPDHSLSRLIAQAHLYQGMLMRGDGKTLTQLAKDAGVSGSYFTRVLRLSFLAPGITATILSDRHPIDLSATRLINDTRLPIAWEAQRVHFGFG